MFELNSCDSLEIAIAGPDKIRAWSKGEVTKPETINYRTQKPERDGLYCERIFGPYRDYECHCGKYKRIRFKGIICDKCGVEVTKSKVRRERMGHIELAAPVTHIWYFKGVPGRIGLMLDMTPKALEQVVYFVNFIVTDPGDTDLEYKQILTDAQLVEAQEKYGEKAFKVGMGAEAIKELLSRINVEEEYKKMKEIVETSNGQKKLKAIKRLDILDSFRKSGNDPTWMILDVLPVIPPDLRPMVQLDGGRFAVSDLNDLYRRVINRNNRLKKLMELSAPNIIVRNEKRMLQEAVDALIDNGRRGKAVSGAGNRELKSLSGLLRGKQGRFRQNLLGKRVDYSGRSVIVVGPELKMYQCGLPKEMALELFRPFVMEELVKQGKAHNIKSAKRVVDRADNSVWGVLEKVIKDHPVLLNRAPTLHRLGIQAFEPVLVEGRAIKLHPLACGAFNADFDGDQMAVHVPLSLEAQAEARFLMLASNNILKLSDGRPVCTPSQDMVMGVYYLTIERPGAKGEFKIFADTDEAKMAYANDEIELQSRIKVRLFREINGEMKHKIVDTTVGKIIFNEAIPQDLGFVKRETEDDMFKLEIDKVVDKGVLGDIVDVTFKRKGATETSKVLDRVKALGYKYSTIGAITTSVFDMHIPPEKKDLIAEGDAKVLEVEQLANEGFLTDDERYNKVIAIWKDINKRMSEIMKKRFTTFNPISMMATSGARGSITQIIQLAGWRGPMVNPQGKTLEVPVKSNFREGLSALEYFIASHGGRKGLADTALKTADSGYLTRRLVDVAQDVIVMEEDCCEGIPPKGIKTFAIVEGNPSAVELTGTDEEKAMAYALIFDKKAPKYTVDDLYNPVTNQLIVQAYGKITEAKAKEIMSCGLKEVRVIGSLIESLEDRLNGRYTAEDVIDPNTGELIIGVNEMVTEDKAKAIVNAGIASVNIRTALTCRARHGMCAKCYGKDMSNGLPIRIGEAVGIIAAQSIGEPGTQLTMRTFHSGGVAAADDITQGLPRVEELFEARKPKGVATVSATEGIIEIKEENGRRDVVVTSDDGKETMYSIPYAAKLKTSVKNGARITAGDPLTEGPINPHDILATKNKNAVQEYLLKEVQTVYRSQGVKINDKHIETIVRQMLKKVRVESSGTTDLLPGSMVDISEFMEANMRTIEGGGMPAQAKPTLLGITKAALATDSFLSAASFQETARVLTDAAIRNKRDPLRGLKENVIIGKLIPAGTGIKTYRELSPAERKRAYETATAPAVAPEVVAPEAVSEDTNADSPAVAE
ncbi:MAG: DNA-directed RNA polymerase subunit beta' [Clostridia bacterium]|nr:DNA-directed RNA polymerase subunit beta' [Clostridia bacterium]